MKFSPNPSAELPSLYAILQQYWRYDLSAINCLLENECWVDEPGTLLDEMTWEYIEHYKSYDRLDSLTEKWADHSNEIESRLRRIAVDFEPEPDLDWLL